MKNSEIIQRKINIILKRERAKRTSWNFSNYNEKNLFSTGGKMKNSEIIQRKMKIILKKQESEKILLFHCAVNQILN